MNKKLISVFMLSLTATLVATSAQAGMEHRGKSFIGKKVFSLMDSNNDGAISKEELTTFHSERFSKIDADADGLVTKQEFKAFRKKQRFMRMDNNGDGVISEDEMALSRQSRYSKNGDVREHH